MAIVTKKREDDTYGKLLGMAGQPSATPTRRVGADTPIGSAAAGPKGGQTAEEFTSTTQASPGSVFKRQLEGAKRSGIGGITALAERPLQREFGQEVARLGQEGIAYKKASAKAREEEPQFQYKEGEKDLTQDIVGKLASGNEEEIAKAQTVLGRSFIPTKAFTTRDIKEFTPQAALRGGSIESLLRQEAKGPYSTGMAGLDALLFKQQGGAKELAQKGQTLRGAGQLAANVLQGKGEGVLDKGIQEALKKVGVTGNLTKEQEELNKKLVEQQKSALQGVLESATSERKGQFQTRLDTAVKERDAAYAKAIADSQKAAQDQAIEEMKSQFGLTLTPEQEASIRKGMSAADTQAAAKFKTPTAAPTLADVATPEEEAQYNRLIGLLGIDGRDIGPLGLGVETSGLTGPAAALTAADLKIGERANVDLMNAYRAAALEGFKPILAGRTGGLPTYSRELPAGRDPMMQEFKEPKEKEFTEISGPYGRYA
jgi:hypothetical protein